MADRSNQRLQTLGIPQAPEADSVMRSRRADSPLGPGLMPNNRPDTCVQSTQSKIYGILQNRGRSYMEYAITLWVKKKSIRKRLFLGP